MLSKQVACLSSKNELYMTSLRKRVSSLGHTLPLNRKNLVTSQLQTKQHHLKVGCRTFVSDVSGNTHPKRTTDKVWDAIIVGGGHNGLVTANYLAREGLEVLVLERRPLVGGAAVTEELLPGYKYSRASYLAGLLRPKIISDLSLKKYGLEFFSRNPSSFTPTLPNSIYGGKNLFFHQHMEETKASIAQFSVRDAERYEAYESLLSTAREVITPLLDIPPPSLRTITRYGAQDQLSYAKNIIEAVKPMIDLRKNSTTASIGEVYGLFTGSAKKILDNWFESDVLKATLATDAVIGSMAPPSHQGTAYVLLHHVMGEVEGRKGVWAYCKGGMGTISKALALSAKSQNVQIECDQTVERILTEPVHSTSKIQEDLLLGDAKMKVSGVQLTDGTNIRAKIVVSNISAFDTVTRLLDTPGEVKPAYGSDFQEYDRIVRQTDFKCGSMKINCAVSSLPSFLSIDQGDRKKNVVGPEHRGTIHFETSIEDMERAFVEASSGLPANRPVIEMTIPTSVDTSLVPEHSNHHIVQLFIQFVPYFARDEDCSGKNAWLNDEFKERYCDKVFSIIEEHCPGFTQSVIHRDILSPVDLENIFSLPQGNIFHGSLTLDQILWNRPVVGWADYRFPVAGLYLCGSSSHPGGGVTGSPGHNAAFEIMKDLPSLL